MTGSGIRQMVWRRSEAAGIGRVFPHQLRHCFAHSWLAPGGNEQDLMRLSDGGRDDAHAVRGVDRDAVPGMRTDVTGPETVSEKSRRHTAPASDRRIW